MPEILDGKVFSKKVRNNLKEEVAELKRKGTLPKLAVILVGQDPASQIYVNLKSRACEEIGIDYEEYLLDENITQEDLINLINSLNDKDSVHGILLQSPIPKHLDINAAFQLIKPSKDVDGFNPVNAGKLSLGQDCFIPCTPYGAIEILEEYGVEIEGKNAVVIGRSNIVGKPMLQCLLNKNATVTVCHSRTKNIADIAKNADILVAAIGKSKFVTADMVKPGAVVVDVGINRGSDGKVTGDVDYEEVSKLASYITPVPGGIGPMTIAMLMKNVVKAAKNKM